MIKILGAIFFFISIFAKAEFIESQTAKAVSSSFVLSMQDSSTYENLKAQACENAKNSALLKLQNRCADFNLHIVPETIQTKLESLKVELRFNSDVGYFVCELSVTAECK